MPISNRLSLADYPTLQSIVEALDNHLSKTYPDFFGSAPTHPVLPLKRHKVLHDNLWGTNRFTWAEWLIVDSPIFQRLNDIHQVGLAFHVYPSAHHKRFEHSLGVLTLASRTYDSCLVRSRGALLDIAKIAYPEEKPEITIKRLRQELRLGALLHDTGHSLFSHSSERVYSELPILKRASNELTQIAGKEKGAGEVYSFCLAQTKAVCSLLERGATRLLGTADEEDYDGQIDLANVSLIIVGRSAHPFLQFLGDIVSSAFDADKLDYLIRDATAAGLPLRYDLDRYLFGVRLVQDVIADGEGLLEQLYSSTSAKGATRKTTGRFPHYDTYRLRIPKAALNAIEQIVICKMMLFSYLYHHAKVRASEGLLERMLTRAQHEWETNDGLTETEVMIRYLELTDSSLRSRTFLDSQDLCVKDSAYRLINRLIPREVFRINSSIASHAAGALLADFLTNLQNPARRAAIVKEFESLIGEELVRLGVAATPNEAVTVTGAWLDVPSAPKFKDLDELTIDSSGQDISLRQVFPVDIWTQAYTSYSYNVRVFGFSEHWQAVRAAGEFVLKKQTGIASPDFYQLITRGRPA